jgi:predicted DNA-binding protein (MmcQ/YjbR family)
MNVDSIREYCLSFSGTTEKLQWGNALCFKVREKMFAVLGLDQARLTFKSTPETFADLIERQDIGPSPYLGRHNWVKLDRLDALHDDELKDLIRQSYEMATAKAPKVRAANKVHKKKAAKKKTTQRKTSRRKP